MTKLEKYKLYPDYIDSGNEWLGMIPKEWKTERMKFSCSHITDGSHFSPSTQEHGKPYVTVRNIVNNAIDTESAEKISEEEFEKLARNGNKPKLGDVIFSKDGTVGKVAVVREDNFVALSSLAILRPSKKLNSEYLFYFLQSEFGTQQIESHYDGAAIKRITLDVIVDLISIVPPLPDQESIAKFLNHRTSKIDAFIVKNQHMVELLEEKRTALISHSVTKGLNPDVPLKDSDVEWLGKIPEHWEYKRMKFLAYPKRGSSPRPIDDPIYFDDEGEYSWVRISDVTASNKYLLQTEQKLSPIGKSKSTPLEPGELFVSIAATVGKPIITKIKCCIHDGFVWLKNLKHNKEYYYYIFSGGELYKGLGKLGTQLNLNSTFIGNIEVPVPPLDEQESIANYLDIQTAQIDALIGKTNRAIEKLQEYRTALISAAVTGKIDVREEV